MRKVVKRFIFIVLGVSGLFLFNACSPGSGNMEQSEAENTETELEEAEEKLSPLTKISGKIDGVKINMQYGSPGVKGRKIWGGLEPYGQVWRTGANEATWIEFDSDVLINGEKLPKGKYSLFTIPTENEWTLIFNKVWDQWGAYEYDEKEDALRVVVQPSPSEELEERLNFRIKESVNFKWEKIKFSFNVEKDKGNA
ncbi:DUF2911 domain-containing protein [Flexithrix dorotheae]|uniref:DUF2911 domain-containing protein n=1 Tax=Flexithrix dorotheae TaxID=70993 RepID=UPI00037B3DD6|nr:DUF2911 domain-containing protein [Flexithrix dorotheae]